MDKIPRGFVGKTVWAIVSIIPIIIFCTTIFSTDMYLASRFGLTQPREQVPLTAFYLRNKGKVELPERGKTVEGSEWRPRNSRNSYTLTLDNAVIENAAKKNAIEKGTSEESTVMESTEFPQPGINITGDLTIELKENSGNWTRSEGADIRIHSGALVIRGKGNLGIEVGATGILGNRTGDSQATLHLESGQLDIKGACAGISCPEVDIAGGTGVVLASGQSGIGLYSYGLRVEESEGEITAESSCTAVLADDSGEMKPSVKVDEKAAAGPGNVRIVGLDAARLENTTGHEEEVGGWVEGAYSSLPTYSPKGMVTYSEGTFCFDGSVKTVRFAAK